MLRDISFVHVTVLTVTSRPVRIVLVLAFALLTVVSVTFLMQAREPAAAPDVQVNGVVLAADAALATCPETLVLESWFDCMQGQVWAVADREGLASAALLMEELSNRDVRDFSLYCHDVGHNLGDHAAESTNAKDLIRDVPHSCFGGLWHGVMAKRGELVPVEALRAEVDQSCDPLVGRPDIEMYDCTHGAGHAFGMVPDISARQAYLECEVFGDVERVQDCGTGVAAALMERALSEAGLLSYSHGADIPEDSRFPRVMAMCSDELPEYLGIPCWERMTYFAEAAGLSVDEIALACSRDAGEFSSWCARSVGLRFGATDVSTLDAAVRRCAVLPDPLAQDCVGGWKSTQEPGPATP